MFARLRWLALVALLGAPSVAPAQQAQTRSAPAPAAGPRISATATAVRQSTQVNRTSNAAAAAARKNMGKPVAMMIVGGAAFVAGALIGGDIGVIFMVAGAVIGLIGLYQYLQ